MLSAARLSLCFLWQQHPAASQPMLLVRQMVLCSNSSVLVSSLQRYRSPLWRAWSPIQVKAMQEHPAEVRACCNQQRTPAWICPIWQRLAAKQESTADLASITRERALVGATTDLSECVLWRGWSAAPCWA